MKKIILLISCVFLTIACKESSVEKPGNLIAKDKMIDILYDVSLLEAAKSQNIDGGLSNKTAYNYIYKKHKIDSLQLVKSNKYYASNIDDYKKMVEKVKERLDSDKTKIESEMKKKGEQLPPNTTTPPKLDVPTVQ